MKKLTAFILALFCVFWFVGCKNKSMYQPTEVENVSIRISDVSSTGATAIIQDSNEQPYLYGEWYKIERCLDGQWYDVDTVIDNYGFNMIGYMPDIHGEIKFSINWEWLYGKLPSGDYRIQKHVDSQTISVAFHIE